MSWCALSECLEKIAASLVLSSQQAQDAAVFPPYLMGSKQELHCSGPPFTGTRAADMACLSLCSGHKQQALLLKPVFLEVMYPLSQYRPQGTKMGSWGIKKILSDDSDFSTSSKKTTCKQTHSIPAALIFHGGAYLQFQHSEG